MPLRGDLIRAILPYYKGNKIETAGTLPAAQAAVNGPTAAQGDARPVSPEEKPAAVQTGVIINAKGIQPRPALLPRILDETGREIYGPLQVDVETAARTGLAGYFRNTASPQAESRVEKNPIIVKAIRTEGPGRSNILISNIDAERLRAADSVSHFLSKAKVIISID